MSFKLQKSASLSAQDWFDAISKHLRASGVRLGSAEVSQSDTLLDASLVESGTVLYVEDDRVSKTRSQGNYTYTLGGFFAPITPENHEEAIRAIFKNTPDKGQWLIDYHHAQKGMAGRSMTPRQYENELKAIATELKLNTAQQWFVLMLNEIDMNSIMLSERWIRAEDISNYRADGTITASELYDLFATKIPRPSNGWTLEEIIVGNRSKGIQGMGEYANPFIHYVGGIMQGRADFESARREITRVGELTTYARHTPQEFDTMPAIARALVNHELNGSSFENALDFLDGLCGSALSQGRYFHPLPDKGSVR